MKTLPESRGSGHSSAVLLPGGNTDPKGREEFGEGSLSVAKKKDIQRLTQAEDPRAQLPEGHGRCFSGYRSRESRVRTAP